MTPWVIACSAMLNSVNDMWGGCSEEVMQGKMKEQNHE